MPRTVTGFIIGGIIVSEPVYGKYMQGWCLSPKKRGLSPEPVSKRLSSVKIKAGSSFQPQA
jgi:hypothetical protein